MKNGYDGIAWERDIAFYLDGVNFAYRKNPLQRAPTTKVTISFKFMKAIQNINKVVLCQEHTTVFEQECLRWFMYKNIIQKRSQTFSVYNCSVLKELKPG